MEHKFQLHSQPFLTVGCKVFPIRSEGLHVPALLHGYVDDPALEGTLSLCATSLEMGMQYLWGQVITAEVGQGLLLLRTKDASSPILGKFDC
jgi:hypothetical protein